MLVQNMIDSKKTSVFFIALSQVAIMAVWFSASAIAPSLKQEFSLTDDQLSLLTSSVQAGFVVGSLVSAIMGLADRYDPRRIILVSGGIASIANFAILFVTIDSFWMIVLRFLTGVCMAGVYPVGMKLAVSWVNKAGRYSDTGLLVAVLVAALTLGSAAPHLFNAFGGIDWRFTIQVSSLAAMFGSLVILLVQIGPNIKPAPPLNPKAMMLAITSPSLRLANLGYLGHMWELYAMWAWLGLFLDASFKLVYLDAEVAAFYARLLSFTAIGMGGVIGCLIAGYYADRIGRTTVTISAMLVSGLCATVIGFFFGGSPSIIAIICIIWGVSIIADSAQFSASITELAPPERVGILLTMQTAMGFALTLIAIHIMPGIIDTLGWNYAFMILAIGPFAGAIAMWRLRSNPEAINLANGKK
ncbi:MFS transporter [Curvivirga sp.]|uniref:MFS transporter n=1 Tax=Curvivirga sp. TaxID=2856848 RepID=UPI003B5BB377